MIFCQAREEGSQWEKKSDKFGIKLAQSDMKRKQSEEDERISLIRIGGKF